MRKIVLSLIISISSIVFCNLKAQNNLQFNAVRYIHLSCTSGCNSIDSVITVPANKVWKIESEFSTGPSTTYLYIDNTLIEYSGSVVPATPIWLPAGTYTFSLNTSGANSTGFFSVIEFNITP
jgi:hypothetical protein